MKRSGRHSGISARGGDVGCHYGSGTHGDAGSDAHAGLYDDARAYICVIAYGDASAYDGSWAYEYVVAQRASVLHDGSGVDYAVSSGGGGGVDRRAVKHGRASSQPCRGRHYGRGCHRHGRAVAAIAVYDPAPCPERAVGSADEGHDDVGRVGGAGRHKGRVVAKPPEGAWTGRGQINVSRHLCR